MVARQNSVEFFTLLDNSAEWDGELSFNGPALSDVLEAWRGRLARMVRLKHFFGDDFVLFQAEFLHCLCSKEHRSRCRVLGCVGTRGMGS